MFKVARRNEPKRGRRIDSETNVLTSVADKLERYVEGNVTRFRKGSPLQEDSESRKRSLSRATNETRLQKIFPTFHETGNDKKACTVHETDDGRGGFGDVVSESFIRMYRSDGDSFGVSGPSQISVIPIGGRHLSSSHSEVRSPRGDFQGNGCGRPNS